MRDFDRPRKMFKATCSNCGKPCEVPFRPTGEKPVYCSDCFSKMRGENPRGGDRDHGPRRDFGDRGGRPAFRPRPSLDNNRGGDSSAANHAEIKRELATLNSKLDRLTQAIQNLSQAKLAPVPEASATAVSKEIKTKKKVTPKKKK